MDVSRQSGHTDYEWATDLNRIGLTLLGIWPKNNETRRERLVSRVCVIILMNVAVWSCAVPTLHSLFRVWGDLMSMIDNLMYTLPFLMSLIKQSIMWYKKGDILLLLNMMKDDWLRPKTSQERSIMIRRARVARTLTMLGYFIMLVSAVLACVLPTFGISMRYLTNRTDPGRLLPLQTYYIYDRDRSPLYEITYFLQSFSLIMAAYMYTSTDSLLSMLVFHVCGQLENLSTRISGLNSCGDFEGALSCNVRDHRRLIRFINIIDDIFNLMLLGALVNFGILFAFYGFLFGMMMTQGRNFSTPRLLFIMTVSMNTFAHTCLYCVVGEILVTQNAYRDYLVERKRAGDYSQLNHVFDSPYNRPRPHRYLQKYEGVYQAVCEYKWYRLEPRKAKKLLMIMVRAKRTLYLTAGKLFPMTMATFCNMLKTSAGYISVLLAQRE